MTTLHHCGDIISNRYQIITLLGQGGTGKTYSAIDLTRGGKIAIKAVFLSEITDWKTLDLFEREAKVLATLNYPFIPKYLDYFHLDTDTDRKFYLVQELVEGDSLFNLVKNGCHFTELEVKNMAIQILEILNYIHQLSPPVIHRDIKPQNLIKTENNHIYLVDFGAVQDIYRNTLNLTGTIVGTFGYMPPEQFRGKTFFASDLYSLGATLIFILTHRSPAELPNKRLKIDFRSKIQVSEEFAEWLDKMTAPAIEERYHTAEEALQVLEKKRQITPNFELKSIAHNPPKGSKIKLNWNENELKIKVPPKGWNQDTFPSLLSVIMGIIGLELVIPATFAIFTDFIYDLFLSLFLLIICLLLNGLSLFLIIGFLWNIFGKVEITINHDIFIITRRLFKFKYKRNGYIKDIVNISVTNDSNYLGKNSLNCTIEERGESYHWYKFGNGLTSVEQDWLIKEMRDFLTQIRLK